MSIQILFCLDFTINIDIKCPIFNVEKLLIYTERARQRAFIGLWTLRTQSLVSAASRTIIEKTELREAGLRRLQLTVGYKLYINFNAKPLVLFLEIFTSFAGCQHHAVVWVW